MCEQERKVGWGGGTKRFRESLDYRPMWQHCSSSCTVLLLHSPIPRPTDTCIREGSNLKAIFYRIVTLFQTIYTTHATRTMTHDVLPLISQVNGSKVDSRHSCRALQGRWGQPPTITTMLGTFNTAFLTPEIHLHYVMYMYIHTIIIIFWN